MRHKYLPRVGAVVLGFGVAAGAACHDATAPARTTDGSVAYAVVMLPDSGRGAGTRFVHANGAVAGWVVGQNGRRRPAIWRAGVLTVLGAVDSLDGIATRVNAVGDVLLEYETPGLPLSGVRVRRADGATIPVGQVSTSFATDNGPAATVSCCDLGADLTDTRLALGSRHDVYAASYLYSSAVVDVVRGTIVDSTYGMSAGLNGAGQQVGASFSTTSGSVYLRAIGFTLPPLPDGVRGGCGAPGGQPYTLEVPVDIDEAANVLAVHCNTPVWLPRSGGTSRSLADVFGPTVEVHLSRQGGILVARDSTGAVSLWRPATGQRTPVRIAGNRWQIDGVTGVNASGQIAAHGVDRTTGRGAALLLTPGP